ncbi:MAG: aminoacyl-tRNA hydrolase [Gammaproteobacteria bacterium]|nr:aminoacyl-tRNA hydrolase [Gammaproteobacteria bacterium]MYB35903.1 aminoacyl-tRNA hydrolase [Gammaproteobacteria bacterium]
MTIRLIAGLGNPGTRYERTRHNVGMAWLRRLAHRFRLPLSPERKFRGSVARGDILGRDVWLLAPDTYMNLSGDAVGPLAHFYKLAPEEILIAYDEVAFEPGACRLRVGGGHNGHNGIRSVIAALGNQAGFARLRIGVGHPGNSAEMIAYLTGTRMTGEEQDRIEQATDIDDDTLGRLLDGDFDAAMNAINARRRVTDASECPTPVDRRQR